MKKIISVLLVFASIAAIFSVSSFAFNDILADANTFVDNTLGETVAELGAAAGEIFGIISDGFSALTEAANSITFDIMFVEGLNDFLAQCNAFVTSIFAAIVSVFTF